MYKALILTSTAPRHFYFINTISRQFDVTGVLTEKKRSYYTTQRQESRAVQEHFQLLKKEEMRVFAEDIKDKIGIADAEDINEEQWIQWAISRKPDVIFLFGTSILKDQWLSTFPDKIVNLHLGLSPFYRGSATLFWPFLNHEIECVGTTIHLAEKRVDAGRILKRIKPDLVKGETYYQITNKLIKKSIDRMPGIVEKYLSGGILPIEQEQLKGRLYKKSDFTESALKQALSYANNEITEAEIKRAGNSKQCQCSQ